MRDILNVHDLNNIYCVLHSSDTTVLWNVIVIALFNSMYENCCVVIKIISVICQTIKDNLPMFCCVLTRVVSL